MIPNTSFKITTKFKTCTNIDMLAHKHAINRNEVIYVQP